MIPSRSLDLGGIITESIRIVKVVFGRSLFISAIAWIPGLLFLLWGANEISVGLEEFTHEYTTASPETSVLIRDYVALKISTKPELMYYRYQYPDIFSALDSTKQALETLQPDLTPAKIEDKLDSIRRLVNDRTAETTGERLLGSLAPGLILYGIGCLLLLFGGLFQRGALFDLCCRSFENRSLKLGTIFSYSFYRTMWLIAVQYLLIFLAMMLGMGLIVGIASAISPVFGVLALFMSFVIVVYALFRLLFCNVALVSEEIGPIPAIKRSLDITAGQFWRVAGITIIVGLMVTIAGYILILPVSFAVSAPEAGLANYFRTGIGLEELFGQFNVYLQILIVGYTITGLITASFLPAFITTFYYDLRTRLDGPLEYDPAPPTPNPAEIFTA